MESKGATKTIETVVCLHFAGSFSERSTWISAALLLGHRYQFGPAGGSGKDAARRRRRRRNNASGCVRGCIEPLAKVVFDVAELTLDLLQAKYIPVGKHKEISGKYNTEDLRTHTHPHEHAHTHTQTLGDRLISDEHLDHKEDLMVSHSP